MGFGPTHGNESHKPRRPREGADPASVDSRFRGNDLTFERAEGGISLCLGPWAIEKQGEIPRFARNDTVVSKQRGVTRLLHGAVLPQFLFT